MRITELRLGTLSIPLKKPFKTALRSTDTVTTNIVTAGRNRRRLLRRLRRCCCVCHENTSPESFF